MQNNYYFLRQLTTALKKRLTSFELGVCFSQNKDELILGFFSGQEEFFIKAILTAPFTALSFPPEFKRSKKNSVDLFKDLIGLRVLDIVQHLNERSFHIEFEKHYKLMFKMHGRRSNILLYQNDKLISLFNHQLKNDLTIDIKNIDRSLDLSFEAFENNNGELSKVFPTFGHPVEDHVNSQTTGLKTNKEKWTVIKKLLDYLDHPQFFISAVNKKTSLTLFEPDEFLFKTTDPVEAANYFVHEYLVSETFEQEKAKVISELEKKKVKSENYIQDLHERLHKIQHELKYDEIANIIMANMHAIPERSESAELIDFYTNKKIKIKLNKNLNAQKNAAEYYRKSKNQKIEVEKIKENIGNKIDEINKISIHLYEIEKIKFQKELKKYFKEHSLIKEDKGDKEVELFKHFKFEGFEILVGKNAKNNDLLTQQYTFKEDLWLHARDVSGSHVVIKYQAGKKFPKTVIHKAAELAAYYSKRKTDTLCPVIFTPKKYVRKRKGAPDGAVVVDKEEVIMVEPKSFNKEG
jgi:predicted ribosome quality control (RQC) complex YloA/Tae2 family protein